MSRTGYDSVASTTTEWHQVVPVKDPQVIGSYGNGRFANTTAARQAFPHATHVQYDVNGSLPEMDLLDIERFDATPAQAPGWARKQQAAKVPRVLFGPGLYSSASDSSSVITAMLDDGWKREQFLINSAHFDFRPHICGPNAFGAGRSCGFPQADSTQYGDKGPHGENVDTTLWGDHCFSKAPLPVHDPHYDYFDNRRRILLGGRTEQGIVREYDKWRATQSRTRHPHRTRLAVLRHLCNLAALRLAAVPANRPHRTFRLTELTDRARGERRV